MKYLPAIDLWMPGISAAILSNQLRLQVGQWVYCGSDKPSRYVKHTGRPIWAAHPEGVKGTKESFKSLLRASRGSNQPTIKPMKISENYKALTECENKNITRHE